MHEYIVQSTQTIVSAKIDKKSIHKTNSFKQSTDKRLTLQLQKIKQRLRQTFSCLLILLLSPDYRKNVPP